MKREDVRKLLPAAADEQIDRIMNLHSADVGTLRRSITGLPRETAAFLRSVWPGFSNGILDTV